jgi:hypothetical protein
MENPMTRNGKVLAGAAAVLALGSAAALAHRYGGGHPGQHHGWRGAPGILGLAGPLCRGNATEKADLMLVRLEYRLKPTDAQKPAFDELKSAVKSAAGKVAAACPAKSQPTASDAKDQGPATRDITARLADAEAQLTAALDGLKTVRPAAEKLYASLDEAQKKAVSEFGMGGHAKGGRHHGRPEHHGRSGPQGRDGWNGEPDTGGRGAPRDDGAMPQ